MADSPWTYRAAQMEDFSPGGQRALKANVRDVGRTLRERAPKRAEVMAAGIAKRQAAGVAIPPKTIVNARTMASVAGQARNVNVTLDTAADARVNFVNRGITRARAEVGPDAMPRGAGWYFEHHRDVAASAAAHGYDRDIAISASAAMSPVNAPANEKVAVEALMRGHRSGALSDLSPEDVNRLGKARVPGVASGGTARNIEKATRILRGESTLRGEIAPTGAPKVTSYDQNIRSARPDTPEHVEYMSRVHNITTQAKGQGQLDLYGLQKSDEGILGQSRAPTTEDTWMNTISFQQPNVVIPGTKTNVAKTIASDTSLTSPAKRRGGVAVSDDPEIGPDAMKHAFSNAATRLAAKKLTEEHAQGSPYVGALPAVAVQEMAWTEVRIQGQKDPEFAKEQRDIGTSTAPIKTREKQLELPTAGRTIRRPKRGA